MNGHIVIPHRSHFTWQRTALVISQDFAGLQLAVLNLPATAVQRETVEAKIARALYGIIYKVSNYILYVCKRSFILDLGCRCGTIFYTEIEQKDQERERSKKEGYYCMMSDLEEQLYVGRLFDLETIKRAFLSL